jgi:hypothetical protein
MKQHQFKILVLAASLAINGVRVDAASMEGRTSDAVNAGDEQTERMHQLKGDQTETRQTNGQMFRIAGTNGWFSWNLKVLPDEPLEMRVDFGGGGRRGTTNKVEILVDDSRLATLRLTGAARREYYPLDAGLLKGRSNIVVKFQAVAGSSVSGVSAVCVEKVPPPTIASTSTASSTRTNYQFIVKAVNDLREPAGSRDRLKRHFDWWPAKATNQWVQYDFVKPAHVSTVEVYWFDDTGIGECRMPISWQLFYRKDGEWKPVTNPSGYGCEPNQYNQTTFDQVETDGLRLQAQMPDHFSSGILQWRVE